LKNLVKIRVSQLTSNYHPISLSVCYKLLECVALQRISPTVEGLLSPDQAGFPKGRSTRDQVAAFTTFIENGFQQNLKTGTVFLGLTAAYDTVWHTGLLYKLSKSMPYWLSDCCFDIDVSGCTRAMTPVLGDPNVTAFLEVLSLHRFCSTCTPTSYRLHVAKNPFTLTTYVLPFKANTSANWNAVSRQIWRGCHTSVDSGDLSQSIASKTISSVFHLHNTSATRELSVYLDGQHLRHECHRTYLGVTLDRRRHVATP